MILDQTKCGFITVVGAINDNMVCVCVCVCVSCFPTIPTRMVKAEITIVGTNQSFVMGKMAY